MHCPAYPSPALTHARARVKTPLKAHKSSVCLELSPPLHRYRLCVHHKEDKINCLIRSPTVTSDAPTALTSCQSSPKLQPNTEWQRWWRRPTDEIKSAEQLVTDVKQQWQLMKRATQQQQWQKKSLWIKKVTQKKNLSETATCNSEGELRRE